MLIPALLLLNTATLVERDAQGTTIPLSKHVSLASADDVFHHNLAI